MGIYRNKRSAIFTRVSRKAIICDDKGNGERAKKALRLFSIVAKRSGQTYKIIYKGPSRKIQQFDWNRQTIRSISSNRWSKACNGGKCKENAG